METEGFFQFEIIITVLVALSDSFQYLWHWSTAIINMFTLRTSDPDVQNRFRAVRVKLVLLCVNDK